MLRPWRLHFRETFLLALPVCFSNVGQMLVDVADSFFLGRLGTTQQAAQMLAVSFYVLPLVFCIGTAYGLTPLIAESDAKNDKASIIIRLRNAFAVNFLISTVMLALLLSCASLLTHMQQPLDVVAMAVPFLGVIMFSLVPLSFFFTLKQFTEGMSDTRTAMIISLSANILNIVLNILLVFGYAGVPAMGMMGSCWATFISRFLMALAMWLYVYYRPKYREYRAGLRLRGFSWKEMKQLFSIGIPSGMQFTFEVGAFSAAAVMIGKFGKVPMAAHRIALSLASLTYMVSSGIGAVAAIRVGNAFGKGNVADMRRAGLSASLLSGFFMLLCAVIFIICRFPLTEIFNKDHDVTYLAASLLLIAAVFQLSDGIQVTALGALRGIQDTRIPTLITLIAYWGIGLPASWLLGHEWGFGIYGIWFGFVIALTIAAVGLLWRFRFVLRRKK